MAAWRGPTWRAPEPQPAPDQSSESFLEQRRRVSSHWLFAAEGATHAPVDAGINAELETPFGLRLSGGYGWVPSAYVNLITQIAGLGTDAAASTLVADGWQNGHAWRIAGGIRPFKNTGVYLDAGYERVSLNGAFAASALGLPNSAATQVSLRTTIQMWFVELGYETALGKHVVLGAGIGTTGTLGSSTAASAGSDVEANAAIVDAANHLDRQVERYGLLPTLSARLGFNLI